MNKYRYLPIHELMKPTEGSTVMLDRYWVVNELDMAVFFKDYNHPQCNSDPLIANLLLKAFEKDFGHSDLNRVELIKIAYLPWE